MSAVSTAINLFGYFGRGNPVTAVRYARIRMVFVWKYEVLFECIFSHAAKAQYVSESLEVQLILMPFCQFPKFTLVYFKI